VAAGLRHPRREPEPHPNMPFDTLKDLAPVHADRNVADADHRASVDALQDVQRGARRGEEGPAGDQLRHHRLGQPRAPRDEPRAGPGGREDDAHPLQGRRPAGAGRDRGPRADRHRLGGAA
jgi:hypothetical protein